MPETVSDTPEVSRPDVVKSAALSPATDRPEKKQGIAWQPFDKAKIESKAYDKPLYLHFYGDGCLPCLMMDRDVFTKENVIAFLNQFFVSAKVHVGQQPSLSSQFGVSAIPTDIVFLPNGRQVSRRLGGLSSGQFLSYLRNVTAKIEQPSSPNRDKGVSADTPPLRSALPTKFDSLELPVDNKPNSESAVQTEWPVPESEVNSPVSTSEIENASPFTKTPYGRWLLDHPDILAPLLSDGTVSPPVQSIPTATKQPSSPNTGTVRQYNIRQPQRIFRRR